MSRWYHLPTFVTALRSVAIGFPLGIRVASSIESTAVLRLLASCRTAGVAPISMLEAWAAESCFWQGRRLRRLAKQLRTNLTINEAIVLTPGVVTADHAAAICFGSQLNLLDETLRQCLATADCPPRDDGRRRFLLGYLLVILLAFIPSSMLIAFRIMPTYEMIFHDFGMELPAASRFGIATMNAFLRCFLWGLIPLFLFFCLNTFSRRFRHWRHQLTDRIESRAFAVDLISTAVTAGLTFSTAAEALAATHYNPRLARAFARNNSEHQSPGAQLSACGLIPRASAPLVDRALAAQNGGAVLQEIAQQLRDECSLTRSFHTELLAPTLALSMGLMVAIEVLAVFMPLVNLVGGLS